MGIATGRVRKILFVLASSILVVALVVWAWVESVATRKWADMEVRLDKLRKAAESREGRVRPAKGSTTPGSAWSDYDQGLQCLWDTSSEEVAGVRGKILEHIHNGSRRERSNDFRTSSRFVTWDITYFQQLPEGARSVALGQARELLKEGQARESAEVLLDFLRFTFALWSGGMRNISRCTFEISIAPLDELQYILVKEPLSDQDLLDIEGELEGLEALLPPYLLNDIQDVVRFGDTLRSDTAVAEWMKRYSIHSTRQWRYLFSRRIAFAVALEEADRAIADALQVEAAPYPDAKGAFHSISSTLLASKNPMTMSWVTPHSTGMERQRLVEIRLLRMVSHYRRTGALLKLEDPFGTHLQHSEDGPGRIKVSSVGEEQAPALNTYRYRSKLKYPPLTIEFDRKK